MRRLSLVCLLALVCSAAFPQSANLSTPERTIRTYIQAINAEDYKLASTCVVGGKNALGLPKRSGVSNPLKLVIKKIALRQNTAVAHVELEMKPKKHSESLNLKQVNSKWLIVPPAKGDFDKAPLNAMAHLLTLTQMPKPVIAMNEATQCLQNIKQLAIGAYLHAADHGDKFALKSSSLTQELFPYLKNRSIFKCPSKGNPPYAFNERMANISASSVKDPSMTVLFYEGSGGKLNFRHDGKAAVAFVNGSARRVDAQAAKSLRWSP